MLNVHGLTSLTLMEWICSELHSSAPWQLSTLHNEPPALLHAAAYVDPRRILLIFLLNPKIAQRFLSL